MRKIARNYWFSSDLLEHKEINFCMPPGHLISQNRLHFFQIAMADEENRLLAGKLNPNGTLV
jgi:hypothetical protein